MGLEAKAVRDPMLRYLQEIGWKYLEPEECLRLRGNVFEPFLLPVLRQKLKELNRGIVETDEQVDEIVKRLRNVRTKIRGNQEFLQYLRGEKTIYVEKERRELNVKLIDFDDLENNEYNVTKEFEFTDTMPNRPDMVLFINGIPVLVIETKSPSVEDATIEAFAQIKRYHEETPELMKIVQLYALSDGIRLLFGPTWALKRETAIGGRWKKST